MDSYSPDHEVLAVPDLDFSEAPAGSDRRTFMVRSAMATAIVALGGQMNPGEGGLGVFHPRVVGFHALDGVDGSDGFVEVAASNLNVGQHDGGFDVAGVGLQHQLGEARHLVQLPQRAGGLQFQDALVACRLGHVLVVVAQRVRPQRQQSHVHPLDDRLVYGWSRVGREEAGTTQMLRN